MRRLSILLCCLAALSAVTPCLLHASLVDYGFGLIYDTDQNLTWLQDAKYSLTSGYDDDGLMTWPQANVWAQTLNYMGVSGWRLPATVPSDPPGDKFNQTDSEMAYLYYVLLGNSAGYYGFSNPGPFEHIDAYTDTNSSWWSVTPLAGDPNGAWLFNWFTGAQDGSYIGTLAQVWAVHDGNVGATLGLDPVPVPASILLMGSGLAGLAGLRRVYRGVLRG